MAKPESRQRAPDPRGPLRLSAALAAFFASGLAGLVYEICWIRQSTLVFGAPIFAVSTTVAAFFAGLALGSYVFGRWAHRIQRPLRFYALLEGAVAAYGLLSLPLFAGAEAVYAALYPALEGDFARLTALRSALVALILLPPTFLMGGTLPLLCRALVRSSGGIGLSVGLLYGWNTLGAATGCALCGFVLLPAIGIRASVALAALINVAAALAAWYAGDPTPRATPMPGPGRRGRVPEPGAALAGYRAAVLFGLFFLTGFVALGNEILWARFLSLLVRNSVYAYTIGLTVVLLGIVLGSGLAALLSDRVSARGGLFGAVQALVGLSGLCVLLLPATWWRQMVDPLDTVRSVWVFLLVLLPPAALSGAAFPLAVRMVVTQAERASAGAGSMTAANTFGGILGSMVVGFYLLPAHGMFRTLLITSGASIALALLAWALLEPRGRLVRLTLGAASVALYVALPLWMQTRLPTDFLAAPGRLVDYREGLSATLAVVRGDEALKLEMNRLWQGQDRKGHQIMAAHVPMLLHADPRRVLVIGVGTGQTPSRFLHYDVEQLDCVDLEARLFELIGPHFGSAWMNDPRVRLMVEDGRNLVAHTRSTYDVISIEVGQVFRPGIAAFYTREFYEHAAARLRDGGLVCQFVPAAAFTPEDFRLVVRTFVDAFPGSALWYNTAELLLIGGRQAPPRLRPKRLALLESDAGLRRDLEFAHWGGPAEWLSRPAVLLSGFLTGGAQLRGLAGDGPLYRDDRPVLEYRTVRYLERAEVPIVDLLRGVLSPIQDGFAPPLDPGLDAEAEALRRQNLGDVVAAAFARTAIELPLDRLPQRVELLRTAIQHNPRNVRHLKLMGDTLMAIDEARRAGEHYAAAEQVDPNDPNIQHGLARALHVTRDFERAAVHYRRAIELNPGSAETHANFGALLAERGEFAAALEQCARALCLESGFAEARKNLRRIVALRQGRWSAEELEAIERAAARLRDCQAFDDAETLRRESAGRGERSP
jgi:spermidine synthase